jgi:protease YdgD
LPVEPVGARRRKVSYVAGLGLVAVLFAMHAANPAELPLLPGIGAVDRRVAVDPRQAPWDAIAKVQTNTGTHCTGALVAPSVVLTAAHCLFNKRTRALLQAGSLHVLIGYDRGDYRWHRPVARFTVGSGYDGRKVALQGSDWARLELAEAIPGLVAPLPVAAEVPPPGTVVALAGYNQDRAQILMADLTCHVTGAATAAGGSFITHDCDATRGTSGGPLLMRQGGRWVVVGINIAASTQVNFAVPVTAFAGSQAN